jgi:hypothetical protein
MGLPVSVWTRNATGQSCMVPCLMPAFLSATKVPTLTFSAPFCILTHPLGSGSLIDIFRHLGMAITSSERAVWVKVIEARKKRDSYHHTPNAQILRRSYKRHAKKETGSKEGECGGGTFVFAHAAFYLARRREAARKQKKVLYQEDPEDTATWVERCIRTHRVGECMY